MTSIFRNSIEILTSVQEASVNKRKYLSQKLLFWLFLAFLPFFTQAQVYNVLEMGATPDGKTLNTNIIQSAIDKCSKDGGKVVIPKGVFLSGTLYLKNNVNIYLEEGAVLLGSSSFKDYPSNNVKHVTAFTHSNGISNACKALLFGEDVQNITISGKGTIDGNGKSPEFNLNDDSSSPASRLRPCMILLVNSRNIKVMDLYLTNSAYWLQNYQSCDGLHLKGLKIYNHANYNNDAIDIDSRNVLIEDCVIDSDDDGICLKSHDKNRLCENIIIRNCIIATNCNAIKFGTYSASGFKNVDISNCSIKKASEDRIRKWQDTLQFIGQPITVIAGLALEMVDGGIMENVKISNIQMADVQTPIFMVMGDRKRSNSTSKIPTSRISNIHISNVKAVSHSKMSSAIIGLPNVYAENIMLNNITFSDMGKGSLKDAKIVLPEVHKAYPENRMFGQIYPSSGLYLRHVKGLEINNLHLNLRNPDYRPAIFMDNVVDSKLNSIQLLEPKGPNAAISIVRSRNIEIQNPKFDSQKHPLVQIERSKATEIKLSGFEKYEGWQRLLKK
jgi:polygalacturonase